MSEEEIKNELDKVFWQQVKNNKNTKLWFEINYDNTQRLAKAIQGLLDIYYKQKKEIKELKSQLDFIDEQNRYIDKLEKEIEKLEDDLEQFRRIKEGETIIYKAKAKYVREDKINKYYVDKNKIREIINNTEKNIEEDRPSIVLENLILNIKELLKE